MWKTAALFVGGLGVGAFVAHQIKDEECDRLNMEVIYTDAFSGCSRCMETFKSVKYECGDTPNKKGFKEYALQLIRNGSYTIGTKWCLEYMKVFWNNVKSLHEAGILPKDFWSKNEGKWVKRLQDYENVAGPVWEYYNELENLKCLMSNAEEVSKEED